MSKVRSASLIAIAAALLTAPSALAQQTAGPAASEVIIVTAQKREQNLQEVPLSVAVVDGDAISPAVSTVDQLLTTVPSLNFKRGGTPLDSSLFLRGVGTINFSIAAEPSVATVVDGVVLGRAGEAFGDLYDIERIEVLRGPQGTLFGKNASAGVINIVTKRPGDTFGGQLEAATFTDSEIKLNAAVDLPVSDTLGIRLSAFAGQYDGNIANLTTGEDINGYDRWGARGIAEWEANDKLTFTLIGDYRNTADDGTGEIIGTRPDPGPNQAALLSLLSGVNLAGDETRQVRHNITSQSKETSWGLSLQADYDLGGLTLTSITAYRDWSIFGVREGDWLDRPAAYVGNAFAQLHDFGPQDNTTFTQEVRLSSPSGERLEYVVGAFYYNAESERTFRRDTTVCTATTTTPDATGLAPCRPGQSTFVSGFAQATWGSEFENLAVFGDATYDLTDRLSLLGGLRFARDELSSFHDRIPSLVAGLPGLRTDLSGFRDSTDSETLTGRAGVQFAITPDINSYATYTRGYKGPAFNAFFGQSPQQRNVIPGEDVDAYEVGIKASTFDDRAIVNAAIFRADYQNFQANSFDTLNGVVVTRLTSAGDVSTTGAELDAILRPTDALTFSGGIAYTDAQIERFRAADGSLSEARKGERLALAPELKYTIAADYRIEPTNLPFIVRLNAQYAYTDEQFSDLGADPRLRLDSYGALDAEITFMDRDERFSVSLIGRNLTDESFASLITPGGPGGSLRYQIPREADQYFGVAFRSKFGG
jgi:iron complex outermembrane recepter protein